ncbi:hypothetical protein PISMIDRAFT_682150 [Pisolithus microcarpus 441]|uniref:Uncharacterized protein n=1 Tax=Pisolithus microcarpus 441 TaxID=765257 RepID=A0A0C9YVC6_9AGAM|nr:hypothetical protein PISMIDRAFT_682150 [Pisolithus microcarpus 441]
MEAWVYRAPVFSSITAKSTAFEEVSIFGALRYTHLLFLWFSYWTLSPMINQGCLHIVAIIGG